MLTDIIHSSSESEEGKTVPEPNFIRADYPTIKEIILSAFPFSAARAVIVLGDYGNAILISRLGRSTLAGYNLINSIQAVIISTPSSILYATGILVGEEQRNENSQKAGSYLKASWVLSVILSLPAGIFAVFSDKILILVRQPAEASEIAGKFFRAYAAGIPGELMLVSSFLFMLAIGKTGDLFIASVANAGLTLGFAYPLIFGYAGFPRCEIAGLGYASNIAAYVTLMGILIRFKCHSDYHRYGIFNHEGLDSLYVSFKGLLKLGVYIGFQSIFEVVTLNVNTFLIGSMGLDALITQQLVNQYQYILTVPLLMGSQALSVLTSKESSSTHIRRLLYSNLQLSFTFTIASGIFLIGIPQVLMSPFIDTTDSANYSIIETAEKLYLINAGILVVNSFYYTFLGGLRGLQDTVTPMWTGLLSNTTLNMLLGYSLSLPGKLGLKGISIASLITNSLSALFLGKKICQKLSSGATRPSVLRNLRYCFSWSSCKNSSREDIDLSSSLISNRQ